MIDAVYVSNISFTVEGDQTPEYTPGRKILLKQGVGGNAWTACDTSSYSAVTGLTTVTVTSAIVVATLVEVTLGSTETASVALHDHTEEDQAGDIPAAHMNQSNYDALIALLAESGVIVIASGVPAGITSSIPGYALVVNPTGDGFEFGEILDMEKPTGFGQLIRSTVPDGLTWVGQYYLDHGTYSVDEVVSSYITDRDVFFKCILEHESGTGKAPSDEGGATYWEEIDLIWEYFSRTDTSNLFLRSMEAGLPYFSSVDAADILVAYPMMTPGEIGDLLVRTIEDTRGFDVLPIGTPDPGAVLSYTGSALDDGGLAWRRGCQIIDGEKYATDDDLLVDEPVYLDPVTGKYRLATNIGTFQQADCCGIVKVPNEIDDVAIRVLIWGPHTFDSDPSFTSGNRVYLGDGVLQDTEPESGYVVILGRVEYGGTDVIFFNPEYVKPTT